MSDKQSRKNVLATLQDIDYNNLINENEKIKKLEKKVNELSLLQEEYFDPKFDGMQTDFEKFRNLLRSFQKEAFNDRKKAQESLESAVEGVRDELREKLHKSELELMQNAATLKSDFAT
mmetsp:Transcript_36224/g.55632  ORF Transcript_36224/g.55632 Transcript_36224/m.55632 type:complete len:119 (+) Transcript_36224:1995-2351(+)